MTQNNVANKENAVKLKEDVLVKIVNVIRLQNAAQKNNVVSLQTAVSQEKYVLVKIANVTKRSAPANDKIHLYIYNINE